MLTCTKYFYGHRKKKCGKFFRCDKMKLERDEEASGNKEVVKEKKKLNECFCVQLVVNST